MYSAGVSLGIPPSLMTSLVTCGFGYHASLWSANQQPELRPCQCAFMINHTPHSISFILPQDFRPSTLQHASNSRLNMCLTADSMLPDNSCSKHSVASDFKTIGAFDLYSPRSARYIASSSHLFIGSSLLHVCHCDSINHFLFLSFADGYGPD